MNIVNKKKVLSRIISTILVIIKYDNNVVVNIINTITTPNTFYLYKKISLKFWQEEKKNESHLFPKKFS